MANPFVAIVSGLFQHDATTRGASVELWVVVTTGLLLAKFAVGTFGPRLFSQRWTNPGVQLILVLNYTSLNYTLGLMEPSSELGGTLDSFFQVWAVLIVTMQYSVKVGLPYWGKDLSLVDLLSSLWSANLLRRSNTALHLRLPLWLIWSLNASRIIRYYFDSSRAAVANTDNMKLVSDYMMTTLQQQQQQHTAAVASPTPATLTMTGYRYLVLGEEEQKMEVERPSFKKFELTEMRPDELITVEKVWRLRGMGDRLLGEATDGDNRYKDVCLSFALYKLLRRRFFDFPIPEAKHTATRDLVFDAILEDNNGYERAFRVTEVELSFLHDFSYSKHAIVFAGGFPVLRLLLSVLMLFSLSYMVYAVRDIPSSVTDFDDDIPSADVARITHGVFVTIVIIAIIVCRELWEIGIYVLSQWTKVLIICHYVRLRLQGRQGWIWRLQRLVMEVVARIMFWLIRRGRWNQKIHQYNLLLSAHTQIQTRGRLPGKVKLHVEVKKAMFESLKALNPRDNSLGSYFQNAFGSRVPNQSPGLVEVQALIGLLEGDTHKVLVWHVATCLCQIKLLEEARQPRSRYLEPARSFTGGSGKPPQHYITAVSLSNYCAYLVTQALVPDNGLVANKVFEAVFCEARDALRGCRTPSEMRRRLVENAEGDQSIIKIGARLSKVLRQTYVSDTEDELWESLGKFWAGFLLHLSASTRAAKHRIHLQGRGELTTHLWALLSHAGFLGDISHGEQMLDPEDLNYA